jgi:hypothetical protein
MFACRLLTWLRNYNEGFGKKKLVAEWAEHNQQQQQQ